MFKLENYHITQLSLGQEYGPDLSHAEIIEALQERPAPSEPTTEEGREHSADIHQSQWWILPGKP